MRLFFLSIALLLVMMSSSFGQTTDYIPPRAFTFKDTIQKELDTHFPSIYDYNYVPSLIELESCISLKHSRCWSPTSSLKTSREEGAGLGQITRAYRADGSVRFDSLAAMRTAHKTALAEADWRTIYTRPDIQIRMIVLMLRDVYQRLLYIPDAEQRMQMTDAAYNGGLGDLNKEIRRCKLIKGCEPSQWTNHVERVCLKSKTPIYGKRSACDINREHVRHVFDLKLPKYRRAYFTGARK